MKCRFNFLNNYLLSLCLLFLVFSCKGIASLPKEPTLIGREDPVSLARDEASLFEYALSLSAWLIDAKSYVNAYYKQHKFPLFENFDPTFKGGIGEEGIKARIAYYKRYIALVKPIAIDVYRRYTQVSLQE
ncbi:BBA14 family lipoprotein (plasmid) [Borrelia puertoricensis]|uniref:BBA14 family lipoprotein n=1 Tax=Borrelia puertoricensis TaxID=2756107 RepID=UPI003EBB42CC